VVLAPATANLIARAASGIADDYLTTVLLAATAPVLVCPAMNTKMYQHPLTRRNLETLRGIGYHVLEPGCGVLACKEEGPGRLADPSDILEAASRILTPPSLAGRKILVSAGPTWEPFDPVRYITNPSSGKMGYAVAAMAAMRSAEVHLVSGPSSLRDPFGVSVTRVTTALEMRDSVMDLAPRMDVVIMAAAVSDYRPEQAAPQKLKKVAGELNLRLVKNPDILALLGQSRLPRQILIGFAAETENLLHNATQKLVHKKLDLIVANDLTEEGAGFASDTNRVKLIGPRGDVTELPTMSKEGVANRILDAVEKMMQDPGNQQPET
jgi:phosphopantothenoylcysteine decarboxylase/phosphopantothenate--cysteine ligase